MAALVSFYDEKPTDMPEGPERLYIDQQPLSEADNFEVGFPEPDVVYVRHPVSRTRLIPLASYHSQILVEKTNDAIAMLTALGASKIDLSYSGKISDQAKADVDILFGVLTIGLGGSKNDSEHVRGIYQASGAGARPRALPPLTWIDQPGWRGIIDGRLHGGLREFALTFTYEHDSGVDANLASEARQAGLRIGGEFRKAHRVSFNLRGEFPALGDTEAEAGYGGRGAEASDTQS
jgi:hypothetical protein